MAQKAAATRLRKEMKKLHDDPIPCCVAAPREDNILEWRFVLKGSDDEGSPYAGGYYQGKLVFPPQYPWKPPSVLMCTPSGRFQTDRRICLSISDYHPESWVPSWNVGTILLGVISFFHQTDSTVGSMETTDEAKIQYARKSCAFNAKDKVFVELFGSSGNAGDAFDEANATLHRIKMKATGGTEKGPACASAALAPAPAPAQKTAAPAPAPAPAVAPGPTVFPKVEANVKGRGKGDGSCTAA